MPWCDHCNSYLAPNALESDGTCPDCSNAADTADLTKAATSLERAPWHFWVMVVALVGYLGWRLVQGVVWLVAQV